jgi:ABC-type amino acid transport substrate-binding protein
LQQILASGELRVGISADRPPLNAKDRRGEIVGFEADIIRSADAMGLELRFVVEPFSELIPSVERAEVDLAISGLTMTHERNARVAFAGPYFISGM